MSVLVTGAVIVVLWVTLVVMFFRGSAEPDEQPIPRRRW